MSARYVVSLTEVQPNRFQVICTCLYQGRKVAPICRAPEMADAHVRGHVRRGESAEAAQAYVRRKAL